MGFKQSMIGTLVALDPKKAKAEIRAALKESKGNKTEAARKLGVHRDSLYVYLARLGLVSR